MLKRSDVHIVSNPTCSEPLFEIIQDDFKFYDKDGFELNKAEQKFYNLMHHPINEPILNHSCWQETWFNLEDTDSVLILDHCMILHRCNYSGHAEYQLNKIKKDIAGASWLLNTKQKWGFDFALDALDPDGNTYEVLHVEYDSLDYDEFTKQMINFDFIIRHTDWFDAAIKINQHKDEWINLKSWEQNNWKSNFLIGWKKSEYTEKSLTF